jgi:hypothetical protein
MTYLPEEIKTKLAEYPNEEEKEYINNCFKLLEQFLKEYPFKEAPSKIDALTPNDLYNKGGEYFFKWVEHKLKPLGHLTIGSAKYLESARENCDKIKILLKVVIDDAKSLAQKVDAGWDEIPWFGGDQHIAKKVIYLYNSDKALPIFRTGDMEEFVNKLNLNYEKRAIAKYGKGYGLLSTGQEWELLTELLIEAKPKGIDNLSWAHFFYTKLPPSRPPIDFAGPKKAEPLHAVGLLFKPAYEQEVIYLFSILHRELGFPYIVHLSDSYPDAIVVDDQKNQVKIEFELTASSFIAHGHPPNEADYIVCWENDLTEEQIPAKFPKIIAIKDYIEQEK